MTKPAPRRPSRAIPTLAILIAVLATLYFARDVFIPLAFAVTLTLILTPVVIRLVKMHMPRALAAVGVVVISIVATAGIGFVLFNQLVQVLNELPQYQENIHTKIEAMRAPSKGALARATQNVQELGKELSSSQTPVVPPTQQQRAASRRNAPPDANGPLAVHVVAEPANQLQYIRDLMQPFPAFAVSGQCDFRCVMRTRVVPDRRPVRCSMGRGGNDLPPGAVCRVGHRRFTSAAAVSGGIR
jgi:hypothetical protein